MDLVVNQGASPGTQTQYIFVVKAEKNPCFTASNLERLKSGLENYVLKHGNCLDMICDHCFSDRYINRYIKPFLLQKKHSRLSLVLLLLFKNVLSTHSMLSLTKSRTLSESI